MGRTELRSYEDFDRDRRPSLVETVITILAMLSFLAIGLIILGMDAQIPLIWTIIFIGLFARYWLGYSWDELYDGINENILKGLQAIIIIFLIFGLITTLTMAGTIPALMYYGIGILTPAIFLPAAAVLSAIVALTIGSSWTTAGTVGIALMAIGSTLGFSEPLIAGAVLTGAYTGDKQSPLSDTTNLAAAISNTDLYDHVNSMRVGTAIAFALSVVLYTILGWNVSGSVPTGQITAIQNAITGIFSTTPLVFIPLLIIFGLAIYGIPAIPSLTAGFVASVLTAIWIQDIGFTTAWSSSLSGINMETNIEVVNSLVQTDGMFGSVGIITLVFSALIIAGLLESSGMIAVITHHLKRYVQDVASLTFVTSITAVLLNIIAATPYMAIVVPGLSYKQIHQEQGLKNRNLSRAIDATGATTGAFIPWNATAVFVSGALGVPTLSYAPYYFFGFFSPLVLLLFGITGWQIEYEDHPTSDDAALSGDKTISTDARED